MKTGVILSTVAVLCGVMSYACGGPSESNPAVSEPSPGDRVVQPNAANGPGGERYEIGEAIWFPSGRGEWKDVLAASDAVVVARVVRAEDVSDASRYQLGPTEVVFEPGSGDRTPAQPQRDEPTPKPYDASRDPITASRYTLEVEDTIWSREPLEKNVQVIQGGGRRGEVVYELHGDPILELNERYLFALRRWEGTGYYTSAPWGRFVVTADGRARAVAAEDWGSLPITSVSGQPVAEVANFIRTEAGRLPTGRDGGTGSWPGFAQGSTTEP